MDGRNGTAGRKIIGLLVAVEMDSVFRRYGEPDRTERRGGFEVFVYEDEESIDHLDRSFSGRSDVIPVTRKKAGGYTAASRLIDRVKYAELAGKAREAVCSLAEQILDGDISASPAILDAKSTACDYCPYKEACGFDPRIPGYSFRK